MGLRPSLLHVSSNVYEKEAPEILKATNKHTLGTFPE
jgi:hypothetical protein